MLRSEKVSIRSITSFLSGRRFYFAGKRYRSKNEGNDMIDCVGGSLPGRD